METFIILNPGITGILHWQREVQLNHKIRIPPTRSKRAGQKKQTQ